jgi:hypothetical protein
MNSKYLLLILSILTITLTLRKTINFPQPKYDLNSSPLPNDVQILTYDQKVSHFNFKLSYKSWKQKYLLDLSNWSKSDKGPILMYCGNEGPIEMFYKNTGWYNDYVTK